MIEVADLRDLQGFIERVASEVEGPPDLAPDAEEVVAINWATTAPGIDWPERYWISTDTSGESWILWVEPETMEAYGEDLPPVLPVAMAQTDSSREEAAGAMLAGFWRRWAEFDVGPPESVLRQGILSRQDVRQIAAEVWRSASSDGA